MRPTISKLLVLTCLVVLCLPFQAAAQGNLRYTVGVTEFENQAGWYGHFNIGNAWGTVLTDLLNDTGRFIVLGESDMRAAAMGEQDLGASGRTVQGAKTPVTGQMTPAQILIKGAITHVQHDTAGGGGGVRVKGIRLGGKKSKSEVNVTIYMVDSTTGIVLASESVVGIAGGRGANIGYSSHDWGGSFGGHKDDNLGQAISDAAGLAVDFMAKELQNVPWTGSVVMVQDGKVYVNRGTREGVASGQEFVVGDRQVIRDPDTGEVLDESVKEIARLRADTVKDKLAICSVISGNAGAIQKGQGIQVR